MSYLISDKEIQTPYSMIVAGKTDGSRTLFNFLGRKSEAVWPVPAEAPDVNALANAVLHAASQTCYTYGLKDSHMLNPCET